MTGVRPVDLLKKSKEEVIKIFKGKVVLTPESLQQFEKKIEQRRVSLVR
jgi:hypothetical protein